MGASSSTENEKACLPPGPRRYPVLGNLTQLKGNEMFYVKLSELQREYGDVVYIELGALKVFVLFGHDKIRTVLEDEADSFKYRPVSLVEIKSLDLGNGIVWSNGPANKERRKFASSILHPGAGSLSLAQRVQMEAEAIVQELRKQPTGDSDTLKGIFHKAICNINCALIFGERYEYSNPEFSDFVALMDQLLQRQGVKNLLNFFPILQHIPESKKIKETKSVLHKVGEFIHGKVEAGRKNFDKDKVRSLIDAYLEQESSENPVTEENLVHIVRDFFVAGTENVAIGLLWCVGYMTKFENIQEKCTSCVNKLASCTPDMTDGAEMPYVEATVNEVLRLANVAPLSVPHAVLEDTKFEGYSIPKDTMVLTHLVSAHKDPKYWDDPDVFRPERFLGSDGKLVKKTAFYPFSVGPRYCLAAHLARVELLNIFSTLLKNFKFEAVEKTFELQPTQPGAFVEPRCFQVVWNPLSNLESS